MTGRNKREDRRKAILSFREKQAKWNVVFVRANAEVTEKTEFWVNAAAETG